VSSQPASRIHIPSIFQLLLSGLSLAACVLGAGSLFVFALVSMSSGTALYRPQSGMLLGLAWVLGFFGLVCLPSIWFAIQRLSGHPVQPTGGRIRLATLALALWPLFLAAGQAVSTLGALSYFILPPIQIIAVVIPLWWLVELVQRNLPLPSPQRNWGALNFSLFVSTPLVIVVEILGLVLGVLGVILVVSAQPDLARILQNLNAQVLGAHGDPETLLRIYRPYLESPWAIFLALAVLSGLVPLVEELIKPLAVWTLVGRRLTPGEGLIAGAIAGGGFALMETLFSLLNTTNDSWLALTVGRAGTGVLHTTTAALMGFTLAEAFRTRRFLRLGLMYLLVTTLHGLWNAFSILNGISDLIPGQSGLAPSPTGRGLVEFIKNIGVYAPVGMVILTIGFLLLLWAANRSARRSLTPVAPAPVVLQAPAHIL